MKADGVEIDTVDAYQGREKDVVIFSSVRTAIDRGIGFVRDVRRLNVGITRARCSLIVLGNARALASGSGDWANLVSDADERGLVYRIGGFPRQLTNTTNVKWLYNATEALTTVVSASGA